MLLTFILELQSFTRSSKFQRTYSQKVILLIAQSSNRHCISVTVQGSKPKLYRSNLALTLLAAISSLLSESTMNQDGGNSLEFQNNMKKYIGPKSKTFLQKCLKVDDKRLIQTKRKKV